MAIIITASFLALVARYGDNQWDPIQAIQQLKHQNRRDNAIDLVQFLKDNRTYSTDELARLEDDVAYGLMDKAKSMLWDGAVKGNVNDTYSGIGAMAADCSLFGDLRDITKETWNMLFDQDDFNGVIAVLSGAGIAFSTVPLFDGLYAMNKNTAKYVARLLACMNKGMLRSFLSGRTTQKESSAIYDLLKKTDGRFHAQHHNPANLKHATELISRHKRTGNVFINTAGDAGLFLYAAFPKSLKHPFINAFKRNPKAVVGITRSHLIIHSIKFLDKQGLVSLLIPVAGLSVLLSLLHPYLLWSVFFGSIAWTASIISKSLKIY